MSADPTLPATTARPGALIEFVRTERSNAAYVLLGLAAAFLAGAVYLATQAGKVAGTTPDTPLVDPRNPDAPPPPPAEVENPKKGDYWFGGIGAGVACLIAASAGSTLLVRVPPPGVAEQRSWTRGFVLVVGGLLGLVGFLLSLAYLAKWNEGVVAAVQAYDTGGTAAARAGARWLVQLAIAHVASIGVMFLAIQPARAEERNHQNLRRLVYGGNLGLTSLLLFDALLILNVVFAMKVPNMLDTTESGFYTLSDATKVVVSKLGEPVTAYVILQDDNSRENNDVRQLMYMAQDISGGKFTPRFVSPVTDKTELQKLHEKYPKLDKTGTGIVLAVGDDGKRHEFLPYNDLFKSDMRPGGEQRFQFVGEGLMVQKLRSLSDADAKAVVYFTQGSGELSLAGAGTAGEFSKAEREASQLKTHLESFNLDVRPLELKDGAKVEVPADAKIVVIADPTTPVSDAAAKALKDFMGRAAPDGKKTGLLVLAEPRTGPKERKVAKTGLEGLLGEFNVKLGDQFIYSYPIPQLQLTPRDLTAAFVAGREGPHPIILPFARIQAVDWTPAREVTPVTPQGGPATVSPLMATFPDRATWLEDEVLDNPYQAYDDMRRNDTLRAKKRPSGSPRVVAVAVAEGGSPPNPMNPHGGGGEQHPRMVVFANSEMFSNAAPKPRSGGPAVGHELLAASLDWLRGKPPFALGTIKEYDMFKLPPAETINSTRLYLLPIGLALLTVAGLGAGVWVIRRK